MSSEHLSGKQIQALNEFADGAKTKITWETKPHKLSDVGAIIVERIEDNVEVQIQFDGTIVEIHYPVVVLDENFKRKS